MATAQKESEIRKMVDRFAEAVRACDYEGIVADHAEDVIVFDVSPLLKFTGKAAVRSNWEHWLGGFKNKVGCEIRELKITASGDVAFAHSLTRFNNRSDDGTESRSWVRVTVGFRKTDGKWLVTHEDVSLPFNGQESVSSLQP